MEGFVGEEFSQTQHLTITIYNLQAKLYLKLSAVAFFARIQPTTTTTTYPNFFLAVCKAPCGQIWA